MKEYPRDVTYRSHEFIQSFQLDGLCQSIRLLVSQAINPGIEARRMLKAIRDDFLSRMSGRAFEIIPDVLETTPPADLYVIAELLRSSMLAFLTPEELQERRVIGFHNSLESPTSEIASLFQIARQQASQSGLKKSDINKAIQKVRSLS